MEKVDQTEQEQQPVKEARANVWFSETEIQVTLTALRCYITLAPEFDRVEKTAKIQQVYNDLTEVQRNLAQYKKQKLVDVEKEIAQAQGDVVAGCKGGECD